MCHACVLALLHDELDGKVFRSMSSYGYREPSALQNWNYRSRGWVYTVRLFFVSHSAFSLLGARPRYNQWLGTLSCTSQCLRCCAIAVHRCVLVRAHWEGNYDQVLRTCARHSILTTTIFWRFSISNADGAFIMRGREVEFQLQLLGEGVIAWVNAVYAIKRELHMQDTQFIYMLHCARTYR